MLSESQKRFDRDHIWHPYTSLENPLKVYPVKATEGVHIVLDDDKKLIDGMASWWCAIHGYNHPLIKSRLQEQLEQMPHVMFGGLTHKPAIELCQRLVELSPDGLENVFLCDSGSISVEVALKMALQLAMANGNPGRNKIMTVRKGYHGDTVGAMSVCDPDGGMHQLFKGLLPEQIFLREPQTPFGCDLESSDKEELEKGFAQHQHEVAAVIIEPIVQGAGGMRMYSAEYLVELRRLCNLHGIVLIFDEIATGFGRTGELFASQHAQVAPDIMCVGKALTGGTMTLAATLCTAQVSSAIGKSEAGVLMHGPTFMGNPLACSAALASLEILTSTNWKESVNRIEARLVSELESARSHKRVADVRVLGAIGVIECKKAINVESIQSFFVQEGVWIRPFRNLIYVMPAYSIQDSQVAQLCKAMIDSLDIDNHFLN